MKYSVKTKKIYGKEPVLNLYDPTVNYYQVYILDYYSVIVAFQVCKVEAEEIRLVELALRPYENGWMIYDDMRLSKNPYFVNKNVFTKSDYSVTPLEEGLVPIEIDYASPIFAEALRRGEECPLVGTFYAERTKNYRDVYFISDYEPKKNKIIC